MEELIGLNFDIIICRSISMRAGPAFLQFDLSKAGLSMDLPVFVYFHMKTSFKFLSRHGRYRAAFYVVGDPLLQSLSSSRNFVNSKS